MALLRVLSTVALVVGGMLLVATFVCIGREQLRKTLRELWPRLRMAAPSILLLGTVLLLNSLTRRITQQLSWLVGFNITGLIFRIEGAFVERIQRFATTELTAYFSFIYVFGYVFLLLFPLIAYLALDRQRRLHELTIAYTANYGIGLLCYLMFVAYGPRNLDVAQQFMYDVYPQAKLLTSAVNVNTNVFPSLHSSLSTTVMLFAWRTREAYPRWFAIASVIGTSVIISTMYLGIHWAIDVLGGIGLAYVSYRIGVRYAGRWQELLMRTPSWAQRVRHRF